MYQVNVSGRPWWWCGGLSPSAEAIKEMAEKRVCPSCGGGFVPGFLGPECENLNEGPFDEDGEED